MDLDPEALQEVAKFKSSLREFYGKTKGMDVVFYERFIPTPSNHHMMIQSLAISKEQSGLLKSSLLEEGAAD